MYLIEDHMLTMKFRTEIKYLICAQVKSWMVSHV